MVWRDCCDVLIMALRIEFACCGIVSHWVNTYLITQSFAAGAFAAAPAASTAATASAPGL